MYLLISMYAYHNISIDISWYLLYVRIREKHQKNEKNNLVKMLVWIAPVRYITIFNIHTYIIIINFKYLALGPLGNEIHEF